MRLILLTTLLLTSLLPCSVLAAVPRLSIVFDPPLLLLELDADSYEQLLPPGETIEAIQRQLADAFTRQFPLTSTTATDWVLVEQSMQLPQSATSALAAQWVIQADLVPPQQLQVALFSPLPALNQLKVELILATHAKTVMLDRYHTSILLKPEFWNNTDAS